MSSQLKIEDHLQVHGLLLDIAYIYSTDLCAQRQHKALLETAVWLQPERSKGQTEALIMGSSAIRCSCG